MGAFTAVTLPRCFIICFLYSLRIPISDITGVWPAIISERSGFVKTCTAGSALRYRVASSTAAAGFRNQP